MAYRFIMSSQLRYGGLPNKDTNQGLGREYKAVTLQPVVVSSLKAQRDSNHSTKLSQLCWFSELRQPYFSGTNRTWKKVSAFAQIRDSAGGTVRWRSDSPRYSICEERLKTPAEHYDLGSCCIEAFPAQISISGLIFYTGALWKADINDSLSV